jgi:hypothetical protein
MCRLLTILRRLQLINHMVGVGVHSYKRLIIAGSNYPLGIAYVREKVRTSFMANKHLTDETDIKRAVFHHLAYLQGMYTHVRMGGNRGYATC